MFHSTFLENTPTPHDFSLDLYFLYQANLTVFCNQEYPVFFHKRLYGQSKGGGSFKGKWKLTREHLIYFKTKKKK